MPITLILLLAVFGALVAAGIPVLLAGSAVMAALSLVQTPFRPGLRKIPPDVFTFG